MSSTNAQTAATTKTAATTNRKNAAITKSSDKEGAEFMNGTNSFNTDSVNIRNIKDSDKADLLMLFKTLNIEMVEKNEEPEDESVLHEMVEEIYEYRVGFENKYWLFERKSDKTIIGYIVLCTPYDFYRRGAYVKRNFNHTI
jgi:hypothetical protein